MAARSEKDNRSGACAACALAAGHYSTPRFQPPPAPSPSLLDQERLFHEAVAQQRPLVEAGCPSRRTTAKTIQAGTARPRGIRHSTAEQCITRPGNLDGLVRGANPVGRNAEVVTASDYKRLHAGHPTGIVNPPKHLANNVRDIRTSPDAYSRKDLIFAFETRDGQILWKYNGQVKTGGARYVSDTLVEMATTPGYGKVGYVDARYVNADGTPRVGPGAFTARQARRLQEANVRLRGIPDLEERAEQLMRNVKAAQEDGLSPLARQQLESLRSDIASAYSSRGVTLRIAKGAAIAAASAAVMALVVQLVTEGKADLKPVGQAVGTSVAFSAAGGLADAGLYHLALDALNMTPEAAQAFAQQGVAIGFCIVAATTDITAEFKSLARGDTTLGSAVAGTSLKVALDLLPLVLGPLGLAGLPLLVGTQVGGRWLIDKVRTAEASLVAAIAEDHALADDLLHRMSAFSETVASLTAECEVTDALYQQVMGLSTEPADLHVIPS